MVRGVRIRALTEMRAFFPDRVTERCCGLALTASPSLAVGVPSLRDVTRPSVRHWRQRPASRALRLDGSSFVRRISLVV